MRSLESILDLESWTFGEFALASGGFAENVLAVVAGDDGLSVAEQNGSLITTTAFDVHVVGVRSGNESFEFVSLLFSLESGVEKVSVHSLVDNIEIFYKVTFCYHLRGYEILWLTAVFRNTGKG